MDPKISEFIKGNWGSVASVVGLVLSAISAFFARWASVAAQSAREAVFRRNFADDMAQASRVATELTNFVEMGKYDAALLRCGELQSLSVFIQQRWIGKLKDDSRENCLVAGSKLETIHRVLGRLSKDSAEATPAAADRLAKSCRSVRLVFVKEEAIAKRTVDGGGDAG